MEANAVIAEPVRVDSILAGMDLKRTELMESVRAGLLAQRTTTTHYPNTAGGYYRWAEGFARLCIPLARRGWKKAEFTNVPVVFHYQRRIAVTVSGGNRATGIDPTHDALGAHLRTHRPKGPAYTPLIGSQLTLALAPEEPLVPDDLRPYNEHGLALYFLLNHEDAQGTVRVELSRPMRVDTEGEIIDWRHRIILGELQDDPEGEVVEPDEPITPEVPVVRKA